VPEPRRAGEQEPGSRRWARVLAGARVPLVAQPQEPASVEPVHGRVYPADLPSEALLLASGEGAMSCATSAVLVASAHKVVGEAKIPAPIIREGNGVSCRRQPCGCTLRGCGRDQSVVSRRGSC
jgi:hypothetical protein